jgi:VanZ family protein
VSNGIEAGGRPNPVRKLASVLWVISIGVVCYLSLQPEVDFPLDFERADLAYHSLTYLWLSFLPFIIFGDGKKRLLAALLMIPLGVALEIGQSFVPGRTFSILDMVANSCGTLFGVICGKYLHGAIHKIMRF